MARRAQVSSFFSAVMSEGGSKLLIAVGAAILGYAVIFSNRQAEQKAGLEQQENDLLETERLEAEKMVTFCNGKYQYDKTLIQIGEGSFGKVLGCISLQDSNKGKEFAFKKVPVNDFGSRGNSDSRKAIEEAIILYNMDHKNIVKFIDYILDQEALWLVMEFIEGCNLDEDVKKNGGAFTEDRAKCIFSQLCDALHYLHERDLPYLHRDIKPENIMIMKTADKDGTFVKLVDFGEGKITWTNCLATEGKGTPLYRAPEVDLPTRILGLD